MLPAKNNSRIGLMARVSALWLGFLITRPREQRKPKTFRVGTFGLSVYLLQSRVARSSPAPDS